MWILPINHRPSSYNTSPVRPNYERRVGAQSSMEDNQVVEVPCYQKGSTKHSALWAQPLCRRFQAASSGVLVLGSLGIHTNGSMRCSRTVNEIWGLTCPDMSRSWEAWGRPRARIASRACCASYLNQAVYELVMFMLFAKKSTNDVQFRPGEREIAYVPRATLSSSPAASFVLRATASRT